MVTRFKLGVFKIRAPRVEMVADDVTKSLTDLYNVICDCEQAVVGLYSRFVSKNGKEATYESLAGDALHKIKNLKQECNELIEQSRRFFEETALERREKLAMHKPTRKDIKLDQQIVKLPDEKFESQISNFQRALALRSKQVIDENKRLTQTWQDKNADLFEEESKHLVETVASVTNDFIAYHLHTEKSIKTKN